MKSTLFTFLIALTFSLMSLSSWGQGGAGTSGGGNSPRSFQCAVSVLDRPGMDEINSVFYLMSTCHFTAAEAQCIVRHVGHELSRTEYDACIGSSNPDHL